MLFAHVRSMIAAPPPSAEEELPCKNVSENQNADTFLQGSSSSAFVLEHDLDNRQTEQITTPPFQEEQRPSSVA